jgi:hypothetical protein
MCLSSDILYYKLAMEELDKMDRTPGALTKEEFLQMVSTVSEQINQGAGGDAEADDELRSFFLGMWCTHAHELTTMLQTKPSRRPG